MKTLRLLLVEDSENDEALLVRALQRAGYDLTWTRVETEEAMRAALRDGEWDLIVSDYTMPTFSAQLALGVLQRSGLDLPFIIVSGTVGEEVAVDALKAGAHDFLVKGRLARLLPVIEREMREAVIRRGHHHSERALRLSEARYRTIVETAQEGIWTLDETGTTTYVNQRMTNMLGCRAEEIIGAPFTQFVDAEWKDRASRVTNGGGAGVTDILFRKCDGSEFWGTFSASPILDPDSRRVGTLITVVDMTHQRQLQAQLMMADRMVSVGMLAAGVAHEINNPLAAILFQLDIARRRLDQLHTDPMSDATKTRLDKALRNADDAVSRVRDIVRDLRVFSRAQDDKSVAVDLHAILDSTIRLAWNEIRHRARLTKDYHAEPFVRGNESRLGQVFLNLIVNAAQAIEEGAAPQNEIRVSTRMASDDEVVVEIADSGSGMSPDALRHLFVPFFTTKPVGVGTGLGLTICHRIITSVGGRITIESAQGEGTTVRVFLPVVSQASAEEPRTEAVRPVPAQRRRVLIIDDDVAVVEALEEGIAVEHDVKATSSTQTALAWFRSGERFDAILCDVMMPNMTGEELYEEIRRIAPDQTERVVFLTGGAFTKRARTFLDAVLNIKLNKPVSLDDVLRAIDSVAASSSA